MPPKKDTTEEKPTRAPKRLLIRCINFAAAPFLGKGLGRIYFFRIVRARYREFIGTGGSITTHGFTLLLDPFDTLGFKIKKGNYEPEVTEVFEKEIKPDDIVLDIGANIGYYTLLAAQRAKKVYAFEPNPGVFELLSKNVKANALQEKIVLRSEAVAESAGEVDFFLCDSTSGFHSRGIRVTVPTVALDDTVPVVDFIKIDVEGAELIAIEGGRKIFSGARIVVFEFHPRLIERAGFRPEELLETMRSFGFRLTILGDEKNEGLEKALERGSGMVNMLAKKI